MKTLTNWTARRAGASITITGTDAVTGLPLKLVGVDQIKAGVNGDAPIATDKDGEKCFLLS